MVYITWFQTSKESGPKGPGFGLPPEGASILFPPCGSRLESSHFGLEISDFGLIYKDEVRKLLENSAIRIPKSAIELLQYPKTPRGVATTVSSPSIPPWSFQPDP